MYAQSKLNTSALALDYKKKFERRLQELETTTTTREKGLKSMQEFLAFIRQEQFQFAEEAWSTTNNASSVPMCTRIRCYILLGLERDCT